LSVKIQVNSASCSPAVAAKSRRWLPTETGFGCAGSQVTPFGCQRDSSPGLEVWPKEIDGAILLRDRSRLAPADPGRKRACCLAFLTTLVRPWRDRCQDNSGSMVSSSPTGTPALRTLVPFAKEERISVKEAAAVAGRSERTVRNWCVERGIGRRVGGIWAVSKVALVMWLDGDLAALAAYRDQGARGSSEPVASYYRRCMLAELLERPGFAA
jgi:hypothetical protein